MPGNRGKLLTPEAKKEAETFLKLHCNQTDLKLHIQKTQNINLMPKDVQNLKQRVKIKVEAKNNEELVQAIKLLREEYGEQIHCRKIYYQIWKKLPNLSDFAKFYDFFPNMAIFTKF